MVAVRRGDVLLARLDPTLGVEIKKTRPVIVLSNDNINHFAELAVVVPLTKNTASISPSHAVIPKGAAGLAFPSKAVTEQIRAVDKRRLVRRLGRLTPDLMAHVERALKNTLAFPSARRVRRSTRSPGRPAAGATAG